MPKSFYVIKEITVTREPVGAYGLYLLPVRLILYLEFEKKVNLVTIHTRFGLYYMPGTIRFWTRALNASGHVFRMVDRVNSANIRNIKRIDTEKMYAYFDGGSKKCTITMKHYEELIKEFPEITKLDFNIF